MKIEPKEIQLKNGLTLLMKSPAAEDARAFLDHLAITHKESFKNLDRTADSWKNFPVEQEAEIIKNFSLSKNKFFVFAEYKGRIVGGMGIAGDDRPFRIHSATLGMSIQNEFKNLGLGSQMIQYGLENAKLFGLGRIELTVREYNTSAIHLYEKFGFEKVGKLKMAAKIDGDFVNEYLYQKIL